MVGVEEQGKEEKKPFSTEQCIAIASENTESVLDKMMNK